MDKIAIITLNGYHNYGNRLQNYAMQETLKSLGFQVETILVNVNINRDKSLFGKIREIGVNKLYKKIVAKINYYVNRRIINERKNKFIQFSNEYINETDFIISDRNIY